MSKQATTTKTERAIINPGENPYQYGQALPILPPDQPPITEMDWRKVEPPYPRLTKGLKLFPVPNSVADRYGEIVKEFREIFLK